MRNDDYLMLQTYMICLLLALIGTTAIIRHPDWFGDLGIEWKSN
jgi:hypothetical protein